MKPNIFDRARLMVAQSPAPTTIAAQLGILSARRRGHHCKTTLRDSDLTARKNVDAPRYSWQDRRDLE